MATLPLVVANNAQWFDVVCRTHGVKARFDDDAWTSPVRTPDLFPDAVTLVPDLSVPELLARVDSSAGCSIKDSFASLDLTSFGFRVLFAAEWIIRPTTSLLPIVARLPWEVVRDPDAFAMWEWAWEGDDRPPGVLRAELLNHDSVRVLAARIRGRVVAGAVLYRTEEVVGISNVFTDSRGGMEAWAGCVALADTLFPASILVGYESGDALDAAHKHGFETAGPLRVWLRES